MESMSITEALVAGLFDQDGVDSSNAVQILRNAQRNIQSQVARYDGLFGIDLDAQRSLDEIDDILILASANGAVNYYKEGLEY